MARSTVALTLERVAAAQFGSSPAGLSDAVLEAMLYAGAGRPQGSRGVDGRAGLDPCPPRAAPARRHLDAAVGGIFREAEPDGYGYSRWCELYRAWQGRLSPTMRQSHPAGERMFVDYAGQTIELYDGRTGEIREAQVFVAVMGASSYTYAEGELDADLARLDRLACLRARLHGRRAGAAGPR